LCANPDSLLLFSRRFNVTKGYGFITPDQGANAYLLLTLSALINLSMSLARSLTQILPFLFPSYNFAGGEDIFVHQTAIKTDGFRSLREGEAVEFVIESSDDGRAKAIDVTGPGGAPPEGAPRRQFNSYDNGGGGGGGGWGGGGGGGSWGGGGRGRGRYGGGAGVNLWLL
jgi:cold shock CspA family protein